MTAIRSILALDQSTSGTKAMLFDEKGLCLDRESIEHRQYYPQPGWVEHDAEEIWQNVIIVVRALATRQRQVIEGLVGLSITNQRETIVVFDRATGRPLHPAIVWQCRRGDAICARHLAAGWAPAIHARTGLRLDAYFSGSKLQWLIENRPEIEVLLESGKALVGTIDTYLIYRLTGGKEFATDHTNASRTLLYDITELRWQKDLYALWSVPFKALAEIRESSSCFGETTVADVLPRPTPICGVMADSQASLFAQGCFHAGSAKVTFGTGSSVLFNLGSTLKLSDRGAATSLARVIGGVPTYAFEAIIISSGSTLTWLVRQLGMMQDVQEIESLAEGLVDSGGVHLVPAFFGLGMPYWTASVRAAITGLSAQSNRRHVARAALDSMGFQLCDALEAMQVESGIYTSELKVDGGSSVNRTLMQFTADITRTQLAVAVAPDRSALGAALMGFLGLGLHSTLEAIAALRCPETVFRPKMSEADASELREGWHRAVRQVLAGAS